MSGEEDLKKKEAINNLIKEKRAKERARYIKFHTKYHLNLTDEELLMIQMLVNEEIVFLLDAGNTIEDSEVCLLRKILKKLNLDEVHDYDNYDAEDVAEIRSEVEDYL